MHVLWPVCQTGEAPGHLYIPLAGSLAVFMNDWAPRRRVCLLGTLGAPVGAWLFLNVIAESIKELHSEHTCMPEPCS